MKTLLSKSLPKMRYRYKERTLGEVLDVVNSTIDVNHPLFQDDVKMAVVVSGLSYMEKMLDDRVLIPEFIEFIMSVPDDKIKSITITYITDNFKPGVLTANDIYYDCQLTKNKADNIFALLA